VTSDRLAGASRCSPTSARPPASVRSDTRRADTRTVTHPMNNDESPLPTVGVYGLRTFRVSLDGQHLPVAHPTQAWKDGPCTAECSRGGTHPVPDDHCTCGIYSFRDTGHLTRQYPEAHSLVAVIALEGRTIEGDRGWRSQAAQVVAIWIAAEGLPTELRARLQRNIPDATVRTSLIDMIAGYPHLTRSRQGRADPAGLRRVNSTSRLRWRLLQLISTGRSVLLRAALFAFLLSISASPPSRSGDDVLMRWVRATGAPLMWVIDNPSTVVGYFAFMFVAAIALPLPGQPCRVQRLTHAAKRIAAVPLAGQIVGLAVPWLEWLTAIGAIILAGIAGSLPKPFRPSECRRCRSRQRRAPRYRPSPNREPQRG
jgi:hypothetical protein